MPNFTEPEVKITFIDAIIILINQDKNNEYDDEAKQVWTKLGFDELMHMFKTAMPKMY